MPPVVPASAALAGALLVLAGLPAGASVESPPPAPAEAGVAPVEAPASEKAPSADPIWEGAIGLIVNNGPEYLGSDKRGSSVTPAYYLRYGRFSISNSGGFANRRSDDIFRGLGVDLVRREDLRANLTLRLDRGRQEDSSDALRGMGDVPETVRVRVALTQYFEDGWRAGASWSVDAFGRGGGHYGDVSLTHEKHWSPDTVATATAGLTIGGASYLKSYFGVNEEQSANSGYPVFEPDFGLRDLSVGIGLRTDFGPDWTGLCGISASRLLGPAADSPLTQRTLNWGVRAGLAWRF